MLGFFLSRRTDAAAQRRPEYAVPTLAEHLAPGRPKRILSLDGGGVRGVLSVAILERIEEILRERLNAGAGFRLCDYFDLVGGTSTGSIIAAPLALGWRASEIRDLYFKLAPNVFRASLFRKGLVRAKFDGTRLMKILAQQIGDVTLGSEALKTGLAVVSRRIDTDSNWVVFNNPKGKFFESTLGPHGHSAANKDYRVRDLVRASTAAPYFFQPQRIKIGPNETGLFIDGGLTLHNNPSLQLLLLASLEGYRLNWPLAVDKLLLISIGTGGWRKIVPAGDLDRHLSIVKTGEALASMVGTSERLIETVMQWIAHPPAPTEINSEIGDMRGDALGGKPLISYQRYNAMLSRDWLSQQLGMTFSEARVRQLWDMADPAIMQDVYEIGRHAAAKFVMPPHLPAGFDPVFARPAAAPPIVRQSHAEAAPDLRFAAHG